MRGNAMIKKTMVMLIVSVLFISISSNVLAQVGVHGFVLARTTLSNNNYTSRIERYGIQFTEKLDDEFDWLSEIYIHPQQPAGQGRLYMESAYLNWHLKDRLPWDFTVRIGKVRNYCYGITPSYGNRRTTEYPLYSLIFTQLRVTGFQTFSNFGENFQLALAILNRYNNSGRFLPDFPIGDSIRLPISDRDNDNSTFNRVALSGRFGYKRDILNIGASLYISDPGEDIVGAKSRFGFDGQVKLENGLLAQAQLTVAQTQIDYDNDGIVDDLNHMGFEVLGGWEPGKIGLYARYGMLTFDDQYQDLNSIMLSAVYKIRPRIHFRLEGLINGETTDDAKGWAESENNTLIFETLFAW